MASARFADVLLDAIATELAAHAPERGGALLSIGGITHQVVPDRAGTYTAASWDISDGLTADVQRAELAGRGTLAGTVHTHPIGAPEPSSQDLRATARLLDANPHLLSTLICIVTEGEPGPDDLLVGSSHRMRVHAMRRARDGYRAGPISSYVLPLGADLAAARIPCANGGFRLHVCGIETLAVPCGSDRDGKPVALAFPPLYPHAGPLIVELARSGVVPMTAVQAWDPTQSSGPQLGRMIDAALGRTPRGFSDRTIGLAGSLARQNVVVAGAGSVGSALADALVRAGVGRITVIDPDDVSAPNLARSIYSAADLGETKVDALARHLHAINPAVVVTRRSFRLQELSEHGELRGLVQGAQLVVGATDDSDGQSLLSHHAYHARVPMVACALYKRAAAGEVIITDPKRRTACWRCATGSGAADGPAKDYGTGRLVAELALGPSIAVVSQTGALVSIGLLAGRDRPAGRTVASLLDSGRTMGIISTTPGWEFFPTVFAGMEDHQFAPQSIWARVERDPSCPVCGDELSPPPEVGAGARLQHLRARLLDDDANVSTLLPAELPMSPALRQASDRIMGAGRKQSGDDNAHRSSIS